MKIPKITLIAIVAIISAACHSSKKSTTATASSTPASTTTTNTVTPDGPTSPFSVARSADGIYPPGNEELAAIQVKYKDVTLEKLKEGHLFYTKGACINCHGAQNIYRYTESQWKGIMDDMAQRAGMSDEQKDAVYKYVLAIKSTQP